MRAARPSGEHHDAFLVRLDDAIRPQDEPDAITRSVAGLLGEHLDADRCAYADVEGDEDTFNLTGDYTRGVPSIVGRYRFAGFGEECLRLMRAGHPYTVADSEGDARTEAVREAYRRTRIGAVICVPLLKAGRFVAAMAVHQATPRAWTPQEVELVRRVASRCWESIERARIGRELGGSEARLRAALEAARQVAWDHAPDSRELRCSHTAASVLGLALDHGRVPLAAWDACIHPDDRAQRTGILERAWADGGAYRAEFRWRRPDDGAQLWVEEKGRVDRGADGRVHLMSGMVADIGQRRTAEIERERFFTLGLDLMVVAGFEGRLRRVSPAWEKALGWSAAELTSRPWLDFIHPDDHAASITEAERLFSGQDTAEFENRYRCKDGSLRWLSWRLKTFPEEGLIYGAATDITERKRSQRRDAFLVALDDAIRLLPDPREIIRQASRMMAGHLGADRCVYCAFEADGETFTVYDHPLRAGLEPMAGRMALTGFGGVFHERFRADLPVVVGDTLIDASIADAREPYARFGIRSFAAVPLLKRGRLAAAWGVHQTVPREWRQDEVALIRSVTDRCWESIERCRAATELRQQWNLFDSALSHTPDFTYIFDRDGRFLYVNRALLSLWEKPLEAALGKDFFELEYPHDLAARLQRQIQQVIATRGPVRDQTPFTDPHGSTRHYEYIFVPILSEDGEVSAVAGSTRDVTDRLRAEEDLRLANDKLSRSNCDLEQFAYIASHDLQEPLRMVSSFVSLLQRRAAAHLDETARGYIAHAITGTTRMQALIRDLLAYARLGEQQPFADVDLEAVFAVTVGNLAARIGETGARVTRGPLPSMRGDEGQLVQLLQNLIANALKFRSPSRPAEVHVSAEQFEDAWTLAVRDNGIGISLHQRQRIFEIFQRVHRKDEYEGTGIGLAICKKIVEQHGGALLVESEEGEGSTFLVRFPRAVVVPA